MVILKKQWKLFLLPLLVPLLVTGSRVIQSNKTLYVGGSGFKTDTIGERSSLGTLSYYLEKEPIPNLMSGHIWARAGSHTRSTKEKLGL